SIGGGSAGIVMIQSDATTNRLGAGSVININRGNFDANGGSGEANPFGAAVINMANNTGLVLGSKTRNSYTFDTQVNVTGTNPTVRIQSRPFGNGVMGGPADPGTFLPLDPPPGSFGSENSITLSLGAVNSLNPAAGATSQ